MLASKLVAVAAVGIAVAACSSSGGGGSKVAYVQQRFAPCLQALGTTASDYTWQNLGRGQDSDGNPAYGVSFTSKDGTFGPVTVNVAISDPKDAIYWSGTPTADEENALQGCMGSPG